MDRICKKIRKSNHQVSILSLRMLTLLANTQMSTIKIKTLNKEVFIPNKTFLCFKREKKFLILQGILSKKWTKSRPKMFLHSHHNLIQETWEIALKAIIQISITFGYQLIAFHTTPKAITKRGFISVCRVLTQEKKLHFRWGIWVIKVDYLSKG